MKMNKVLIAVVAIITTGYFSFLISYLLAFTRPSNPGEQIAMVGIATSFIIGMITILITFQLYNTNQIIEAIRELKEESGKKKE